MSCPKCDLEDFEVLRHVSVSYWLMRSSSIHKPIRLGFHGKPFHCKPLRSSTMSRHLIQTGMKHDFEHRTVGRVIVDGVTVGALPRLITVNVFTTEALFA